MIRPGWTVGCSSDGSTWKTCLSCPVLPQAGADTSQRETDREEVHRIDRIHRGGLAGLRDIMGRNLELQISRFYGFHQCVRSLKEIVEPVRDPERERQEAQAREVEAVKWETFCKPSFHADEYGMHRASYAHSGCEFGRSE